MNKQHWISICLDGHLPQAELLQICLRSYQLFFSKLPQKLQREITGGSSLVFCTEYRPFQVSSGR